MNNIAPWAQLLVMVLCSLTASYVGSLLAVARLQEKHDALKHDVSTEIKPRIQELGKRSHSQQAGLLRLDGRVMVIEDRLEMKRHYGNDHAYEGDNG